MFREFHINIMWLELISADTIWKEIFVRRRAVNDVKAGSKNPGKR